MAKAAPRIACRRLSNRVHLAACQRENSVRPLEGSFLFRDLGVGSSDAARLDGSLPRRFASSSAAARSDASSPSSSRLSALGRSFGNRYRRKEAAMSTPAAFGEETWLAGDASEKRSGVGC